jgi:anti-sigma factor RsiW
MMSAEELDMSCKELVELITEYLEGTLPAADRARFDSHLELCQGCRAYLEQIRGVIGALGKLSEENVPPDAREALLQVFRNWKSGGN